MPTPFAGAAATDATNVPWYSFWPDTVWSFRKVVFGRPANSGWVASVPLSTIVIGTPGPGGVARSAPTSASHHSCGSNGSVAPRVVAAAAEPHAHRATRTVTRSRRPKTEASLARLAVVPRAFVGLGSNLGDREAMLTSAVVELAAAPGVHVVGVSTLIDTEPVGLLDQPRFLNGVVALETELPPRGLLDLLLAVE